MKSSKWEGVFPAVTTKFHKDETIDYKSMELNLEAQLKAGVNGIILLGSLGENGVLSHQEKQEIIKFSVGVVAQRVPVLACVAESTTPDAVSFVRNAENNGIDGFMALPPMRYLSDTRETVSHLRAIADATEKGIMIYNNPVTYGIDITPEIFAELADEPKFVAIKESSNDTRRITDIFNLTGDRYQIFTGVDDIAFESLVLGASGWVAGLVCAFPDETVAIYRLTRAGRIEEARSIYRWFMPLLHLDFSSKLVQNIKLAEKKTGLGTEYVRKPRLQLSGDERANVEKIIDDALAIRPKLPSYL
jgi:4-hydroxy-tetrahydrodipicolinate synthase